MIGRATKREGATPAELQWPTEWPTNCRKTTRRDAGLSELDFRFGSKPGFSSRPARCLEPGAWLTN